MNNTLPASLGLPVRFRGERLRELREQQGLDLEALAKRLALSPAQLRQLENNQRSLFYSEEIRLATARKVSEFLGETLVLESVPVETEEIAPVEVMPSQVPRRLLITTESRLALSGWGLALWGVALVFAVLLGLQAFHKLKPVTASNSVVSAVNPAASVGEAGVAAAGGPPPVSTPSAEPQAPLALLQISAIQPQPVETSVSANQAEQGCGESNGPTASFTPAKADKDAAQIFVQGLPGQVVCVKDGRGQVWRHEFSNSAGRSFFGAAPWLVESNQLAELQIYFQGNRARPSLSGAKRLRLLAAEPAA